MSGQLGFDLQPTSRAAREGIDAETLRGSVWLAIHSEGAEGATDEELAERLGLAGNTARPRRRELAQRNLVSDSGARRTTRSGRKAIVWVAVEFLPEGHSVPEPEWVTCPRCKGAKWVRTK